MTSLHNIVTFPPFAGVRCLMMPYIQGEPDSVPDAYAAYRAVIADTFLTRGERGFLTIDESRCPAGRPHRGARAKFGRALHTEAGLIPGPIYAWGNPRPYSWGDPPPPHPGWGGGRRVLLDPDVEILLANNLDASCAIWDAVHADTSPDGDIGDCAEMYPYETATFMRAGDVHRIGILTPHESLPVTADVDRQFLRIVGAGVYGREPYFTENPLLP